MDFSVEQLAVATGATEANAALYHPHLIEPMARFAIDENASRVAAFFATIGIESAHLSRVEEDLYYKDAERVARIYLRIFDKDHNRRITPEEIEAARPYTRNPKALSELLYQGYHGRSLGQITWLRNYRRATAALGHDYVANPNLMKEPDHAALVACWFFADAGCNAPADDGDMEEVTLRVNGPAKLHLADRTALFELGMGALA